MLCVLYIASSKTSVILREVIKFQLRNWEIGWYFFYIYEEIFYPEELAIYLQSDKSVLRNFDVDFQDFKNVRHGTKEFTIFQ